MNDPSARILGTLHPDGTLELDEVPVLPAGPVEITIRPLAAGPPAESARLDGEGYWPYFQRIRARREAEGYPFRTKEEIDAEMEAIKS